MSQGKSRRRFLIDLLCLAGVLAAASQVQPFFAHFLEDQHPEETPSAHPTPPPAAEPPRPDVTQAYPSDSDRHEERHPISPVTKAYPSDGDQQQTRHPVPGTPRATPKTSLRGPLWSRLT
jgi:hypothetical protein